jgi:hypothetical protein
MTEYQVEIRPDGLWSVWSYWDGDFRDSKRLLKTGRTETMEKSELKAREYIDQYKRDLAEGEAKRAAIDIQTRRFTVPG